MSFQPVTHKYTSTKEYMENNFKYNEDVLVDQLKKYIESTYEKHYVGENNVQALDLIFSSGHGIGFTIGNILKYSSRYGKKNGYNRDDVMKILHYAILLLGRHDIEKGNNNE